MQNQTQNQTQAIANDSHSQYQPVGGFLPALNKAGKVTATAEKQASLLNALDVKGVQALAINGKGRIQKKAAQSLGVDSLESLLASQTRLSAGQVASLRAFLISAYGEGMYNRESHKGLGGLVEYLNLVIKKLDLDFAVAETATAQGRIVKKLATVRAECANVERLIVLRDADIAQTLVAQKAETKPAKPAKPKRETVKP